MRRRIRFANIDVVDAQPEAGLVVRLMMFVNDIMFLNQLTVDYSREPKNAPYTRHLFRLFCGHLAEAMKTVEWVEKCPRLMDILHRSSPEAQVAFARVQSYAKGGNKHHTFKTRVVDVRHKLAFHYDWELIRDAITSRARRNLGRSTVTLSDEKAGIRFGLADDVEATAMTRLVWGLPPTLKNYTFVDRVDRLVRWASQIGGKFVRFAGELCDRYLDEVGAYR